MRLTVVVDDTRRFVAPPEGTTVYLRTSQQAIPWFVKNLYQPIDEIWLDHDLGMSSAEDGVAISRLLHNHWYDDELPAFEVKRIFIHTMNPGAGERMMRELNGCYDVERRDPYEWGLIDES